MRPAQLLLAAIVLSNPWALLADLSSEDAQIEQAKLLPHDGSPGDLFGWAVSISGDTALITSMYDDDNGVDSGAAYVFHRHGPVWTEQVKLLAGDGAAHDYFGAAVSVSGDTVVVGATPDQEFGTGTGSAYVFVRDHGAWTQQAKLQPDDNPSLFSFGSAVSVSGNTVVIGAPDDDENGDFSGSAYVFVRIGEVWSQQAKLVPDDGAAKDCFGASLSTTGDAVVIGAHQDDDRGPGSGAAYIFERHGGAWSQQAKLVPDDGVAADLFGRAVAISGDTVLIGANDEQNGVNSGAAYVFLRVGEIWAQQAKLLASDGSSFDYFGFATSISGDRALVGAILDDDKGTSSGAAYLFVRKGESWTQQAKLLPKDGAEQDWFGWTVAIDGNLSVVGASKQDANGVDSGTAYVFSSPPIFADGFESGDCSGWSFEGPQP